MRYREKLISPLHRDDWASWKLSLYSSSQEASFRRYEQNTNPAGFFPKNWQPKMLTFLFSQIRPNGTGAILLRLARCTILLLWHLVVSVKITNFEFLCLFFGGKKLKSVCFSLIASKQSLLGEGVWRPFSWSWMGSI